MNLSMLQHCCGAGWLWGLGLSQTNESLKDLRYYITKARTEGLFIYHPSYKGVNPFPTASFGALLAVTSSTYSIADPLVLAKMKFEPIAKFHNPIHNSELTLWMLDLNKVTDKELEQIKYE